MPNDFHLEHKSEQVVCSLTFVLSKLRLLLLTVKEKVAHPEDILLLATEALSIIV